MSGEPEVVVMVSGGVVTEVLSNSPVFVTVVDYDNIKESGEAPDLPEGLTYNEDGQVVAHGMWDLAW